MTLVLKRAVTVRTSKRTKCCVIGFHVSDSVCPRGKFLSAHPAGNGTRHLMILEVRFTIKLLPTGWASIETEASVKYFSYCLWRGFQWSTTQSPKWFKPCFGKSYRRKEIIFNLSLCKSCILHCHQVLCIQLPKYLWSHLKIQIKIDRTKCQNQTRRHEGPKSLKEFWLLWITITGSQKFLSLYTFLLQGLSLFCQRCFSSIQMIISFE